MRLKSIEIKGFKSFADKTVLNFGEGITAVVGPNGSGKSNISDAVRWVLGEQSNKTLRGNKMEDVIFSGTSTRKRLGFAEVTLVIDNSDRNLPCDSDEVAVTRRYYRSGESEYRINNASVRLKDVHEMFMDTGLGRDGYSMVGQGKIDDIVGTKTSAERRDIFEEAAGISRYRYRKAEAERKLAQTEDNLVRLRDIIAELEGHVGPLKEQSRKASLFLEYSGEQEQLQIGLWLNMLSKYKDMLREQEHNIAAVRAQYDDINSKIATIESKIDNSADEVLRLNAATEDARRQASEFDDAAAKLESDAAVLRNTIGHNNDTIKRISDEIDELKSSAAEVTDQIAVKKEAIESKHQLIAEEQKKLDGINSELLGLINVSDGYSTEIDRITDSLNQLTMKLSDRRVDMMTSRSTCDEISSRITAIGDAVSEKNSAVKKMQDELSDLNNDLAECEETVNKSLNSLKGMELILGSRTEKASELKKKIDALALEEGEKRHKAKVLQDLERNMEGMNHAVKSVMQAANGSLLRGIHGPVARLITVDAQYSTAIETALGGAVQDIVADTEEDVKRAINYLKNNKGGRATFHPLSVIRPRVFKETGFENCYGFVGMADELVKCDSKYSSVISRLLGGVAVADDLDCAVKIAAKYGHRFRIVTLDGQVVNAGGSMTGGSVIRNAGILSRAGDISALLKQADEIASEIGKLNQKHKAAEQELERMNAETVIMRSSVTTAQEDKIRVLGEIKRVSEQLESAKNDSASLESERTAARARVAELETSVLSADADMKNIEAEIAAMRTALEEKIGGRDTNAAKREQLSNAAGEIKTRLFELNKDIEVLEGAVADIISHSADREQRILRLTEEIEQIKAQNSEISAQAEQISAAAAQNRINAEQSRSSVADTIALRDALDKSVQEMRVEERAASADKEKVSGELVRLEERKISMVHEYDDTIKKMYDEYGLTRSEAEERATVPEDIPAAQRRLIELKSKIRALGNVNVSAIEEYKEVSERYEFMSTQINDVENSRNELIKLIAQLKNQMQELFTERFNAINAYFAKVFTELFGGGTAELKLTDPENTLESGIEIICQPPGKNVSIIEQLSGGEKALIAISIYFAVMRVNPPPFCMLDEVDAALDDVNINRFAAYLRRMSDKSQFIVITHRRGTMEEADMLYGVTMQEKGVSKLLELNVSELESKLNLKN